MLTHRLLPSSIVHCFTPPEAPLRAALAAGAYAALSVADTGHAIPAELLRRVTEPFFTTKAVGQGSGLGLSMVEGFARQSGGALVIDSGPKGTVMTLLLPLAAPEPAPEAEPGPAAASASPVPGRI